MEPVDLLELVRPNRCAASATAAGAACPTSVHGNERRVSSKRLPEPLGVLATGPVVHVASPYRLKQVLQRSVADFHPVPHTFHVETGIAHHGFWIEQWERLQAGR